VADLALIRYELAVANRIVAHEGVLDAFGHVSMRHPENPNRYLLSCSRSPELVEASDIYEFDLDSNPINVPADMKPYGERVIHGCIYQARPDVNAVVHHHAAAILPFCCTDEPLLPIYHLGATMGPAVPMWDMRDDFGDTSLLVVKPEEGRSLAKALGPNFMVLMKRHGATLAAGDLRELVFRTIWSARNAEYQWRATVFGEVQPLNDNERRDAAAYNLRPGPIGRAFEYWTRRLEKAGELPQVAARKSTAKGATTRAAKAVSKSAAPKGANKKSAAQKRPAKSTKPAGRSAAAKGKKR
jgi:ribulose-5-phosphate 4-epimerase/fuculose-1-phosphate aldolase